MQVLTLFSRAKSELR